MATGTSNKGPWTISTDPKACAPDEIKETGCAKKSEGAFECYVPAVTDASSGVIFNCNDGNEMKCTESDDEKDKDKDKKDKDNSAAHFVSSIIPLTTVVLLFNGQIP